MNNEFLKCEFFRERRTAVLRGITFFIIAAGAFVLSGYLTVFSAHAAAATKQPAPATATQTNAPSTNLPVVVEIPKSVFIWNPKEPGFGRDPFFPPEPKTRVGSVPTNQVETSQQTKPIEPPKPKYEFALNGLIGRLVCIVNGKQIMVGNTENVPCAGTKIKVRCDKIEDEKAFITIFLDDGTTETRELSLKPRK